MECSPILLQVYKMCRESMRPFFVVVGFGGLFVFCLFVIVFPQEV